MLSKITLILIFSTALLFTGCKNAEQQKENKQISVKIEAALNQKNFNYLDLTKVSDKDWDKICVIETYTPNEYVESKIGFKWNGLDGIDRISGKFSLLLFIKNKTVIEYVQHPRVKGDFLNANIGCVPRDEANFIVLDSSDNWKHLTLKHD